VVGLRVASLIQGVARAARHRSGVAGCRRRDPAPRRHAVFSRNGAAPAGRAPL